MYFDLNAGLDQIIRNYSVFSKLKPGENVQLTSKLREYGRWLGGYASSDFQKTVYAGIGAYEYAMGSNEPTSFNAVVEKYQDCNNEAQKLFEQTMNVLSGKQKNPNYASTLQKRELAAKAKEALWYFSAATRGLHAWASTQRDRNPSDLTLRIRQINKILTTQNEMIVEMFSTFLQNPVLTQEWLTQDDLIPIDHLFIEKKGEEEGEIDLEKNQRLARKALSEFAQVTENFEKFLNEYEKDFKGKAEQANYEEAFQIKEFGEFQKNTQSLNKKLQSIFSGKKIHDLSNKEFEEKIDALHNLMFDAKQRNILIEHLARCICATVEIDKDFRATFQQIIHLLKGTPEGSELQEEEDIALEKRKKVSFEKDFEIGERTDAKLEEETQKNFKQSREQLWQTGAYQRISSRMLMPLEEVRKYANSFASEKTLQQLSQMIGLMRLAADLSQTTQKNS